MQKNSHQSEQGEGAQNWLGKPFPDGVAPGDLGILREATVEFGLRGLVQHVDDGGTSDGLGIVNAGSVEAKVVAELGGARFRDELHVVLAAKFQAAGRTGLDAGGL